MSKKDIGGYKLGKTIIEGKTKIVWDLIDHPDLCILESKDRITAGDGIKAHNLEGKAVISNSTNGKVFQILNSAGIQTAYVKNAAPNAFVAKKCAMVPIEWVTRRLATGSFLKRREGVAEGYRFNPPIQETFFKVYTLESVPRVPSHLLAKARPSFGLSFEVENDRLLYRLRRKPRYKCTGCCNPLPQEKTRGFGLGNRTRQIYPLPDYDYLTLSGGHFYKKKSLFPQKVKDLCGNGRKKFWGIDDANHDPQWTEEQIVSANFTFNGLRIGQDEVDIMRRTTITVFEILEKAWATRDCALIDMKIEFGVDADGNILVADVIDSDSWRLWPSGDKRLMKDKQVYRNLVNVTAEDLNKVKDNFQWISEQLEHLVPKTNALVVILMGSPSDEEHCRKIADYCLQFGMIPQLRVASAHKGTESTLKIVAEYEGTGMNVVFVAVAGRSNGLGPVLSGNTCYPVINCPPVKPDNLPLDIWSSVNVPSGLGCTTVVYPEAAALAAAQIHSLHNYLIWSKLRVRQLNNHNNLTKADQRLRNLYI